MRALGFQSTIPRTQKVLGHVWLPVSIAHWVAIKRRREIKTKRRLRHEPVPLCLSQSHCVWTRASVCELAPLSVNEYLCACSRAHVCMSTSQFQPGPLFLNKNLGAWTMGIILWVPAWTELLTERRTPLATKKLLKYNNKNCIFFFPEISPICSHHHRMFSSSKGKPFGKGKKVLNKWNWEDSSHRSLANKWSILTVRRVLVCGILSVEYT